MRRAEAEKRTGAVATAAATLLIIIVCVIPGTEAGCTTVVLGRRYAKCAELPTQSAAVAYSYDRARRVVHVAFSGRATSAGGWVGWGINPDSWGMTGSSVLVGFQARNGSTLLPFKLSPAVQSGERLHSSAIDYRVLDKSVHIAGTSITIFASIALSARQSTSLNMVWNRGTSVVNFSPLPHSLQPQDLRGFTTIDVAA